MDVYLTVFEMLTHKDRKLFGFLIHPLFDPRSYGGARMNFGMKLILQKLGLEGLGYHVVEIALSYLQPFLIDSRV